MHEYDQPPPLSNGESERGSHVADLSTVQLIERLTTQVSTLVRTEIDAGLAEVKSKGSRLGVGVGISGAGALLLFLGLATLIATAGLGLATVLSAWLAALIVAIVVLAIGASWPQSARPGPRKPCHRFPRTPQHVSATTSPR